MFTGRSEYRLTQRCDNADLRLTEKGYKIGCVGDDRYQKFMSFKTKYDEFISYLESISLSTYRWKTEFPSLPLQGDSPIRKTAIDILELESVTINNIEKIIEPKYRYLLEDKKLIDRIKIHATYKNEEIKQKEEIEYIRKHEQISLPVDFDYNKVSISRESKEKLFNYKPTTLGAAIRIPGMTPSAIYSLLNYFKLQEKSKVSLKS